MIEFLVKSEIPFIVVMTKKDKLKKTQQTEQYEAMKALLGEYADNIKLFPFSAVKNEGAEEIRGYIAECIENCG